MKANFFIFLFFVVWLLFLLATSFGESDVIVLTDKNFEEQTKEGEWVLEFYAPWCGFCKQLMPIYEEFATTLKSQNTVKVAKIDCTQETALLQRFSIKGFPTIKFLSSSEKQMAEFQGKRTVEALSQFANGGWKSSTSIGPIPPADNDDNDAQPVVSPFERRYGFNIWWIIGTLFGVFIFSFVGILISCYTNRSSGGNGTSSSKTKTE